MTHDIRRDYQAPALIAGPDDPLLLFQQWLDEACADPRIPDPTAFVLATVDAHGNPDARVVLLKQAQPKQLVFYTNYSSAKGQQLDHHAHVAMNFYWPTFARQVRITGVAARVSREQSERYFASRPKASQASAAVSRQSHVVDRAVLHQQYQLVLQQDDISCPTHWGGYAVTPMVFEFWHGQAGRLHDRIRYSRENTTWSQCFLAP